MPPPTVLVTPPAPGGPFVGEALGEGPPRAGDDGVQVAGVAHPPGVQGRGQGLVAVGPHL